MKHLIFCLFFISVFFQYSYSETKESKSIELNSNWKFKKAEDKSWLSAKVPGCVHTDLLDNKLIPDPSFQKNEDKVKWVEEKDWEYATTFEISGEIASYSNIDLQFDGLDTYADVYLNDKLVLKADNMFIGWNIPGKKLLQEGSNSLRIYFHSAVNIGLEKLAKIPYTLMAANEIAPENKRSNVMTRKAPFHYGWDWGPRLVTCGIWKAIKIKAWDNILMEDIYVKPVKISSERAFYKTQIEFTAQKKQKASMEVWIDNKLISKTSATIEKGKTQYDIDFAIEKPELWWTNGLGGHKLYTVKVKMLVDNKEIQSISKRIGVRTLELVQDKDSIGRSFYFKLNGVPVFMKGANYIPSDIFTTRNTLLNYKRVVTDAVSANMNMLRIWGGAIYENDELYDLFDQNGILAWNDFMFACSVQPNDSAHLENIKKEAEYNVKRLRNHTSIALWCGNNENLRAWNEWGWKDKYTKQDGDILWNVYEKIFYHILPDAVKKYQPEISYWASSPQATGNKPSDRISGDEHDWSVWFGNVPFSSYAYKVPRFVSEYGLQSFPEMKTMKAFATNSDLSYRSPVMEHRQRSSMPWIGKGFNGNEMIKTYIAKYYKEAANFESFIYLSQLMQAEGVRFAIETHRGNMPNCMGSLYWQINDCWPTMSWSSVDYFGRWKALHYTVKKAFKSIYPIIIRKDNLVQVKVANDKLQPEKVTLEAVLFDFNGKKLWSKHIEPTLKPNSSQIYLSIPEKELMALGDSSKTVLSIELKTGNTFLADNLFYFRDCKDLSLERPTIQKVIRKSGDQEYEISLTSTKLAKNVALTTTKSDGVFSDNYFDIIPGKTYKITYKGNSVDLAAELEIMCVNNSFNQ